MNIRAFTLSNLPIGCVNQIELQEEIVKVDTMIDDFEERVAKLDDLMSGLVIDSPKYKSLDGKKRFLQKMISIYSGLNAKLESKRI